MVQALISIFFVALLSYIIFKISRFRLEGIDKRRIIVLFLLKAVAGVLYVYFSTHIIKASDILLYSRDGKIIYNLLLDGEILSYLQLTLGPNNGVVTENIAASVSAMGYWYDTSAYMVVRFNALVNLLTFGSGMYANSVFFAWVSFLGSFFLAKTMKERLRVNNLAVYATFLTPSLWYWTAGTHKEALSVCLIAVVFYYALKIINEKKYLAYFYIFIALVLLFFTRFFIAVMLIPPIAAYGLSKWKSTWSPLAVFLAVFLFFAGISYLAPQLMQSPNLVDAVNAKKALYESLDNGNTAINLGQYDSGYLGLLKAIPQALFNSLARPHFMDIKSIFLALASLESLAISIMLVVGLFYIKACDSEQKRLVYLFLSFALSYLILTGLIVPNLGAILRYRSVALFFLVPVLFFLIDKKNELKL